MPYITVLLLPLFLISGSNEFQECLTLPYCMTYNMCRFWKECMIWKVLLSREVFSFSLFCLSLVQPLMLFHFFPHFLSFCLSLPFHWWFFFLCIFSVFYVHLLFLSFFCISHILMFISFIHWTTMPLSSWQIIFLFLHILLIVLSFQIACSIFT